MVEVVSRQTRLTEHELLVDAVEREVYGTTDDLERERIGLPKVSEADIWRAATAVLTPLQLEALRLWSAGLSANRIAKAYGISEPVARRRIDRAVQKVKLELDKGAKV